MNQNYSSFIHSLKMLNPYMSSNSMTMYLNGNEITKQIIGNSQLLN